MGTTVTSPFKTPQSRGAGAARRWRFVAVTHYQADHTPIVTFLSQSEAFRQLPVTWKNLKTLKEAGMFSLKDGSYLRVAKSEPLNYK